MSDGSTEVHKLSFQADATQLVNTLNSVNQKFKDNALLVGRSDKELRQMERVISTAAQKLQTAAAATQRLKDQQKQLNKELTASNRQNSVLAAKLTTANKKLAENKAIIQTQTGLIKALAKQNGALSTSYTTIAAKATAANKAMLGVSRAAAATPKTPGFVGPLTYQDATALAKKNAEVQAKAESRALEQARAAAFKRTATPSTPGFIGPLQQKTVRAKDAVPLTQTLIDDHFQIPNALRYQLYDIAATFAIVGAAATLAGTVVFRTGIEWDKNFANVIRTSQVTGTAVEWLKNEFLDLQSAIPVTAADLATIGTLGAQMGVAATNLARFTETTAQFSATSGTSVDEAATALSRLDEILPDVDSNYERLASTILKTGVNAVATEQQIVRGTSQIAAMGRIAGLTTPEIVALSSTLSSLGFSPELQRSIVTSSFSRILTATSEVTAETEKFGAVLNLTGKEFRAAWNEDAIGTYKRLISTIAGRGDAVTVLQDLGLASQRLTPNLLKLGQNVSVLDDALADTKTGWSENTELSRQFGIISDTVAARIQVLGQTWEALLVTLDSSDTIVKPLVEGLTDVLKVLRGISKTPGVSTIASVGSAIVVLTGVAALGAAGLAAMGGGMIALLNANHGLNTLLAENSALTEVNTAARLRNTGATAASTAANVANARALDASSLAILRTSSASISALPSILRYAGVIGVAAAAATGLITILATAPDWSLELDKGSAGVDSFAETLKFDTRRVTESLDKMEAARKRIAYIDGTASNSPTYGLNPRGISPTGGAQNELNLAASQQAAALADLEESILALPTVEEKYAAINHVARSLGVTQEDLLSRVLPGLGSALGGTAAEMATLQDETEKSEAAHALWAASLGTSDEVLASLTEGVKSAAEGFLDFGSALTDAYADNGGGLSAFIGSMDQQISDFQTFYGNLGTLVQSGGVQLASFFAEQGPAAAQALTDSLALTPEQIASIESQMSLAAFYASDAFAETFAGNNAILAEVWRKSNGDPAAVAAFNEALASSMTGGSIDPGILAALEQKYGITIPVDMIQQLDPNTIAAENAILAATPLTIPVKPSLTGILGGGSMGPVATSVQAWQVELNGHTLILPVAPDTDEGRALIPQWRDDEYRTPLSIQAFADTYAADIAMQAWRDKQSKIGLNVFVNPVTGSRGAGAGLPYGASATGSLVHSGRLVRENYPAFARGTVLRGPGTGTSDSILARVSNGEAITRAAAVRHYGTQMMEDINNMRFPRYAGGGFPGGGGGGNTGPNINLNVTQMYPTTRDPIKTLKQDAESLLAGIWT